ncbi:metallo-peptidase M12B Reprolysin-like family protein [Lysobacter antibioticus]|uniref:Metallo-peptidase M12B Reprolysin-like family protein n=2 Tax=Lysobacter antibioticus TaxID=84531 RepID=A0A0S2F8F1_LYSAN|nr:metallo-peptidase M12B Reprolysin-like family protein [Lysobacter antibioticus]
MENDEMKRLCIGLFATLFAINAAATDLSPSAVGGGDIPGDYASIDFYISKDDWASTLTLSNSAADQSTVTIHSSTGKTSNLIAGNTDYPLTSMTIYKDDHVTFVYQAAKQRWVVTAPSYTPNSNGGSGNMPSPAVGKYTRFDIADGDWAQAITLPASAPDNSVLAVGSTASWGSKISSQNLQFASTFNLRAGDQYVFVYQTKFQRWFSVKTPVTTLNAGSIGTQMPAPVVPNTEIKFANGNWTPNLTLPATAGDRDRISVISDATWLATIGNQNLATTSTLKLFPGARYDFIFIKENNHWALQSSPNVLLTPNTLGSDQLPDMRTPLVRFNTLDGNWSKKIFLPVNAQAGDEVIVKSDATFGFEVTGQSTAFGTLPVSTGETVRFVRDSAGRWAQDTRVITILLTYSDRAVARVGEIGEKMRLLEGLRLTNEALENSKANFYAKSVGFLKHQLAETSLSDALNAAQTDQTVLAARQQLGADAFYYEDYYNATAASCGLGVLSVTQREAMVGIGALECGTTILRHELAHNMGIAHANENNGATAYAKGYHMTKEIMNDNVIPYYSNPRIYTPDYGVAMGIENEIDAVRAMNERSKTVSEFY